MNGSLGDERWFSRSRIEEKNMRFRLTVFSVLVLVMAAALRGETPLGTGFTFQGKLKESGVPLDGTVYLQFTLWDAAGSGDPPTGGIRIGDVQEIRAVGVTAGLGERLSRAESRIETGREQEGH